MGGSKMGLSWIWWFSNLQMKGPILMQAVELCWATLNRMVWGLVDSCVRRIGSLWASSCVACCWGRGRSPWPPCRSCPCWRSSPGCGGRRRTPSWPRGWSPRCCSLLPKPPAPPSQPTVKKSREWSVVTLNRFSWTIYRFGWGYRLHFLKWYLTKKNRI